MEKRSSNCYPAMGVSWFHDFGPRLSVYNIISVIESLLLSLKLHVSLTTREHSFTRKLLLSEINFINNVEFEF